MLNSLRSSGSNVFVWIILFLLIVGLAGFGIGGGGAGGANTAVASVGDEDVTVNEYYRGFNQEQQRIAQQFGRVPSVDQMRAFGFDQQLLGQLLVGATMDNEAMKLGLSVGDETVRDRLRATGAFTDPSGKFDQIRYSGTLRNMGLSEPEYDEIVREESTRQIFRAMISGGTQVPDTAPRTIVEFLGQQRALDWVRIDETHLTQEIPTPTQEDLQAQYDINQEAYSLPEQRVITYAYATESTMIDAVDVTDAEVQELYDERADALSAPERRLVDQIVFGTDTEANDAITLIRDGSQSFDEIATARGLSAEDIDLGEVAPVQLSPAANAMLFGTETLGVVGPVETDFGPAIYRINAILDATTTTLDDIREDLVAEIAGQKARLMISENSEEIIDLVAGGASIEELAAETIMELATVTLPSDAMDDIIEDQMFQAEAMAAQVGQERDLIDMGNGIAILRVDEIIPTTVQPFEDVRDQLVTDWTQASTAELVKTLGESLAARIDSGDGLADIASEYNLIVTSEPPLTRSDIIEDTPPSFVEALFEAQSGKAIFTQDGETVLVGVLNQVVPTDLTSDTNAASLEVVQSNFSATTAQDLLSYYVRALQDDAGVSVNQTGIMNIQSQIATGAR